MHESKWCKLPVTVKINDTFGAVATDLIILSYAVLSRTLGKLVLKNANQVHFCTIMLSLLGLYLIILENWKGNKCSISCYIVLINDCYVTLSTTNLYPGVCQMAVTCLEMAYISLVLEHSLKRLMIYCYITLVLGLAIYKPTLLGQIQAPTIKDLL
jgi:O-antigen ligase